VTRRCREPHDLRGWRHLVYVYGVGTIPHLGALVPGLPPGPAHFVIMELLTGGSLKMPPRPADVVTRAPLELSSGLVALAAAHVVHVDLKPDNIMLRLPGGRLVLTDYGVGCIARGGVDEARYYSTAGGTVIYMAPELLDGEHESTFASDVRCFALGPHKHPWVRRASTVGRLLE
jgi:serine/threonine protein kinase